MFNYLRNGEEVMESLPQSPETVRELLHGENYYQLDAALNLLSDVPAGA